MQRRREHIECEARPDLGCIVYGTLVCPHQPTTAAARWRRWVRRKLTIELWLLPLVLVPLMICWVWMAELIWGSWRRT